MDIGQLQHRRCINVSSRYNLNVIGLVKQFFAVLVAFLVIDYLWIAIAANKLYLQWIGPISNLKDGKFDVKLAPAVGVYVVMTLALQFFVLKRVETLGEAAWQGAFLGFAIYAVFDLTNYALLKDYPIQFVITDMAWGTFLTGTVAALAFIARDVLS